MLKSLWFTISILLILVIFFHVPQESVGLSGSPNSSQRLLNILTVIGILIYFGIALQINLSNI